MDFTPTEEQRALQSAVRDLASSLTPKDTGSGAPAGPQPFDADAWGKLAEMGLLGLAFAEDKGGFGASAIEVTLAAVELGAARVTLPYADAMAAAAALDAANSPLLADVISGEKLVLTAFGESGATWSPAASARTASGSELAGEARGNTDLSSADAIVTTAGTGDDVGVYLVESPTVDGPKVTLDGAPATRLGGREVLDAALALGNVAQCGEALGAMGAALALTVEYLKTRKQFGVPIMRFQTLTQRAADMYVGVELTRSAVLYAAMALADPGEGDDALDLDAIVSRTKYLVGTYGRLVGQEAIQLHGGIGMTAEYAVGHYTSRLATIERTFGDTRQHLAALAAGVGGHTSVDVV